MAELEQRLLAKAEPTPKGHLGDGIKIGLGFGLATFAVLAATGAYVLMGRPDLVGARRSADAALPADHPVADVPAMIGQLEAKMKQTPNDAEGWRMLGWSYMQTGRNADAAKAYGRAAALVPANAEYLSAQGEALVLGAQGKVAPETQAVFRKALADDPADPRARYFLAVAKDQGGDRKGAMDDWIALLKSAPPGAAWAAEVRGFVEKTAREQGQDISARLPPAPAVAANGPPSPPAPGPTADQVAAASGMSQADQQAMIAGMVDQLAAKLKANPKDSDGWIRLMRARMVLGQTAEARAAYQGARSAFAGDAGQQAALRKAAGDLGVPGA